MSGSPDVSENVRADTWLHIYTPKANLKCAIPHEDCIGAVLISRPQVDKPLKSLTHGQCDARPTVTFASAGHYRIVLTLTGEKLLCNSKQLA